jgi:hypothetical protein
MKKGIVFLSLLLLVGCKSNPNQNPEKIKVLFIGNSLTYYHDMPKTLQAMLDEKSANYSIEQSTFPGMSLSAHLQNIITESKVDAKNTRPKNENEVTETERKIAEKNWDIIILQERTNSLYFPEVVKEVIEPNIKIIKNLAKNKNCQFIMFNTWPSKGSYPREIECRPKYSFNRKKYYINEEISNDEKFCSVEILNLEQNIEILNKSYDPIKSENNLKISNHPNLHYQVRIKHPEIELYDDEYHPSQTGSFLNALEFYTILTNNKPSKLKYNGKLDEKTAEKLKRIFD